MPPTATNILELGCSAGALGASIKQRQQARVVGVEYASYAAQAKGRLDRVIVGDAEKVLAEEPMLEAPFDCLIAADVLEHLVDPWTALRRAADMLSPDATAVISLPNVLWYEGLRRVVRHRRWPRDPVGVFDQTHLRWFALRDAQDICAMLASNQMPSNCATGWRAGSSDAASGLSAHRSCRSSRTVHPYRA